MRESMQQHCLASLQQDAGLINLQSPELWQHKMSPLPLQPMHAGKTAVNTYAVDSGERKEC